MIWFYRTDDLSVIYPQICLAVGAPDPYKEDEKEPVSETLTSSLKPRAPATPRRARSWPSRKPRTTAINRLSPNCFQEIYLLYR